MNFWWEMRSLCVIKCNVITVIWLPSYIVICLVLHLGMNFGVKLTTCRLCLNNVMFYSTLYDFALVIFYEYELSFLCKNYSWEKNHPSINFIGKPP